MIQSKLPLENGMNQYPKIPGLHSQGDVFLALPETFVFQKEGKGWVAEVAEVCGESVVEFNMVTSLEDYQNAIVDFFSVGESNKVNGIAVLLIYKDVTTNLYRSLAVLVDIYEDLKESNSEEVGAKQYVLLFKDWNETSN